MQIRFLIFITLLMIAPVEAGLTKVVHVDDEKKLIELSFEGRIEHGDYHQFAFTVRQHSKSYRMLLFLESGGGQGSVAVRMGRLVRAQGIATTIPWRSHCTSACASIFVAGWSHDYNRPLRIKQAAWSLLGVHHPYHWEKGNVLVKAGAESMDQHRSYFEEMAAGGDFYRWSKATPPREMRYIKNSELAATGEYIIQTGRIRYPRKDDLPAIRTIAGD